MGLARVYGEGRCPRVTAVPDALNGLVELLRVDPVMSQDNVVVRLGPWVQRPEDSQDLVCVGWVPDEGETIEWSSTPNSLGGKSGESFTIQGLVSSLDGDGDEQALSRAMDRADLLVERIRRIVEKNRRLGGAVNQSQLTTIGASPVQNDSGAEWTIRWAINGQVF